MSTGHLLVIAAAELKRVWNDKRFVLLIVVAPIVTCVAFGFVAYRNAETIHTTVFVDSPVNAPMGAEVRQMIDAIDGYVREDGSRPFSVTMELDSRAGAIQRLDQGRTRAVIVVNQGQDGIEDVEVIIDVTENVVATVLQQELPKILGEYSQEISIGLLAEFLAEHGASPTTAAWEAADIISPFETTYTTDAARELRYFDFYASAMMVLIALALPLFLSLISVTSERSRGTIERLFVSPYRRSEIITGKLLAHSVFAVIFTILIVVTLKAAFDAALGNIGLVLLICTVVGINGVIFGLLISSVTYSEAESILVGIMCLLGIMGLITYIVPWETMHPVAKHISCLIPYTYGIQTIRQVNMVGLGFSDVWLNLLILVGFIMAQTLIAIPVLRREVT